MVADGTLYALSTDDYWLDTGTPRHIPAGATSTCSTAASVGPSGIASRRRGRRRRAMVERSRRRRPDARVEAGAEVHDSVLLPGARVERRGARRAARSSGRGASVGAGATLERRRRRRRRAGRRAGRRRSTTSASRSPSDARARHRRRRVHRLAPRRPAAGRGPRGRRGRQPVDRHRWPTWPRRGPTGAHELTFHHLDIRAAELVRADRAAAARGRLPPRRAGRRAGVGRPARVRRRGQHHRQPERARGGPRGGQPQGRLRVERRHDLRRRRRRDDLPVKESPPAAAASRPTAWPRRSSATTCTPTASCTSSSSPRSPSPTCTAPARTPTARPAWSRSSPAAARPASRARSSATATQTRDFVFVDDVVDAFVRAGDEGQRPARSTSAPASRRR